MILATHNANIAIRTYPINTILKTYNDGIYSTYVGNMYSNKLINIIDEGDIKDWKKESIELLEGGMEAFNERGDLYGN